LEIKTDITFSFEEFREKRRVVKIDFKIYSKTKQKTAQSKKEDNLNIILKTKLFLSDIQIKTVLKQYEYKYIKRNIDYTLAQKNIKNIA
jgi:plasmid replication initiation protein